MRAGSSVCLPARRPRLARARFPRIIAGAAVIGSVGALLILRVVATAGVMLPADRGVLTLDNGVQAGILPTSRLAMLDHADEWAAVRVFSFGVPTLKTTARLAQASERLVELQAVYRRDELTPEIALSLTHRLTVALQEVDTMVAKKLPHGSVAPTTLRALVRLHFTAAETLENMADEQSVFDDVRLEDAVAFPSSRALKKVGNTISAVEKRLQIDASLVSKVPQSLLRVLAEESLAHSEREYLRADQAVGERAALGERGNDAENETRVLTAYIAAAREALANQKYQDALLFALRARRAARLLEAQARNDSAII